MTREEALARVRELRAAEHGLNPRCGYGLFDHGRQTEWAIVLIHGFTSCPAMYDQLAAELHGRGFNIVVPRLPRHGVADRLTTQMSHLQAEDMAATTAESVEIASGLGERVVVAGLSLGGVLAGWVAQSRPVDRAVLIAPLFGAPVMPERVSDLLGLVADRMPNRFLWWDSKLKLEIGPSYAYPRFPTHAYGEMLKLGYDVKRAARRGGPECPDIRVVLNRADPAVKNAATDRLVAAWQRHGASVRTYEFKRELGLGHDLISPEQPGARTAEVYPVLIDWMTADVP